MRCSTMHLSRLLFPAVAAAAMALPSSAGAAVALPAVERTLSAASPAASYVAPMSGYVTVRTSAPSGSDWDARLVDAASGRVLARSSSFTSNEVLQTWVYVGQRLRVEGERRSGPAQRLDVSFTFFDVEPPSGSSGRTQLVTVSFRDHEDLDRLDAAGLDVTHNQNGGKADVVVAGAQQLGLLERAGLPFEVKIADLDGFYAKSREADAATTSSPLPSGRSTYRTYEDYQAELRALVEDNPGLVRAVTLPQTTVQGRDVQGVEIATGVERKDDGRPTFFLMGVHHAREWPSGEAAMEFAHMLVRAARTGGDARLQAVLDKSRVLVVPIVNVDGFISSRTAVSPTDLARGAAGNPPATAGGIFELAEAIAPPGGILAYRRKNCGGALPAGAPCEAQYGIDPNRNYGNGWGGKGAGTDPNTQSYRGPDMWSEPEVQNIHEASQVRPVTSLLTLHTVAGQVNRPPARGTDGLAPDERELKALGDAMAMATGYVSQYSFNLYDTSGTTEDWNYAAAGTLGYTIELGPSSGGFHMPYQTGVVDQWTGTGPRAGRGLREALVLAAEAAFDPASHGVLDVSAPAGTKLVLRRDFVTKSSPVCSYAQGYVNSGAVPPAASRVNCLEPGAVRTRDDALEYTAEVGPSGTLEWHVTQSTRPFVGWRFDRDGGPDGEGIKVDLGVREPYVLTATRPDGGTTTQDVYIERGERKALDLR